MTDENATTRLEEPPADAVGGIDPTDDADDTDDDSGEADD